MMISYLGGNIFKLRYSVKVIDSTYMKMLINIWRDFCTHGTSVNRLMCVFSHVICYFYRQHLKHKRCLVRNFFCPLF